MHSTPGWSGRDGRFEIAAVDDGPALCLVTLAQPHRLVWSFLLATSHDTPSQPRCSRVTLVPPSTASNRISTSAERAAPCPAGYLIA